MESREAGVARHSAPQEHIAAAGSSPDPERGRPVVAGWTDQDAWLLSAIVESSQDAIISKDLNGIITSWNKAAELIFGYGAFEVVGQPITLLLPPELLHEEGAFLERLRRGERIHNSDTVRLRKDGSRIAVSL